MGQITVYDPLCGNYEEFVQNLQNNYIFFFALVTISFEIVTQIFCLQQFQKPADDIYNPLYFV